MIRQCGILLLLGTLVACGGGGGSENSDTDVVQPPTGGGDPKAQAAMRTWGGWLAQGFVFSDRDGDGIEDALDTWPDDAPGFAHPTSPRSLKIRRTWTELDGELADDTTLEGHPLHLEVDGLPDNGSETVWVVFKTAMGLRASSATIENDGSLTAHSYQDVTGVYVVAGSLRGPDRTVHSARLGDPVFFARGGAVNTGAELSLQGRNLDDVVSVFLGGVELPIVSTYTNEIVVRMPGEARHNRLWAETPKGRTNALSIDLQHDVEVRVSPLLELSQQERLSFWHAGNEYRISHGQPVTVSLPAWMPATLSFDIVTGDDVRTYNAARVVAWPGTHTAEISADSSLVGRLLFIRHLLQGAGGTNWAAVRQALERVSATPAGMDYATTLSEHVAGRAAAPPGEAQVIAAIEAYRELYANTSAQAVNASFAPPTTPTGPLDDIIGSTVTFYGQPPADKTASASPGRYYRAPDETSGNDYAQVTVMQHGDTRTIPPDFLFQGNCQFSVDEGAWFNQNMNADPRDRVWHSDLCLQLDGLPFISTAIILPGFENPQVLFDQVAVGEPTPQLVHRHSLAKLTDSAYQMGTGGYYLRSDKGKPLCHMQTCYIEVISSGYGVGKNIDLNTDQEALVETLRLRMWVEGIIPWIIGMTGDSSLNTLGVKQCIRDDMLNEGRLYTVAKQFSDVMESALELTGPELDEALRNGLDQKVAPAIRQYVQGQLQDRFTQCLADAASKPLEHIASAIKDKLLEVSGLSKFAELFAFITDVGSVALMPEKFVFKIEYRAEVTRVGSTTIDLYDDDGHLVIDGHWLANLDTTMADQCTGDGWCPEVVITQQRGNNIESRSYQLDQSHITTLTGSCGAHCKRLTIPFAEMGTLQELLSGAISVELAIADPSFSSYPQSKLRIPVPATLTLKTKTKIHAVHPPLALPGETISVLGSRLDAYGASAKFQLRSLADNSEYPMDRDGNGTSSPSEVQLVVPNVIDDNYRIVVQPGSDATVQGLQPLISETQLLVAGGIFQLVMIGEQGRHKDDSLHVRLLDESDPGNVVQRKPSLESLEFFLPTAENNYVDGRRWDDRSEDANGNLTEITARVAKISVRCIDAGEDNTCTVGMRSLEDSICIVANSPPRSTWAAKIPEGDTRLFHLAPGTPDNANCFDAFP